VQDTQYKIGSGHVRLSPVLQQNQMRSSKQQYSFPMQYDARDPPSYRHNNLKVHNPSNLNLCITVE